VTAAGGRRSDGGVVVCGDGDGDDDDDESILAELYEF
jgi:hypothetical protein